MRYQGEKYWWKEEINRVHVRLLIHQSLSLLSRLGLTCVWLKLFGIGALLAQQTFPPPENPPAIRATRVAKEIITLDGHLDEAAWASAQVVSGFTQRDPIQGAAASYDTQVRILYSEQFLYIGATCLDSLPDRKPLRVLNLQRDFSAYGNDRFSVAIDGLMDKRNAVGFEVTPYGSQREIQVIDGDEWDGNDNWDALWYVRTQITDSAWITEMAIPWKTIRYKENSREMLISFSRNIRRNREITTWPTYPRAFTHFRIAYAALLTNIDPPPPSANVQINPYLLGNVGQSQDGQLEEETHGSLKVGGEFKWAVTPNAVLDGTINTDFAQADVDQQVQNLTRFTVLFPERRQFFLENANIFRTSSMDFIQPFFSRKIGLDDRGSPIPLDAGLRFTSQTSKQTSGVLAVRQRGSADMPASHFGVGRYVRNFSGQSRLGGMVTWRRDDAFQQNGQDIAAQNNATATVNGFFRPKQSLSLETMVSASSDTEAGNGLAAVARFWQDKNWGYLGILGQYASQGYLPGMGFLALNDYMLLAPSFDLDLRPKWLPSYIRSYGPDGFADIFWRASDGAFQQAIAGLALIDMQFQTGGDAELRLRQEWQQLDETFSPLGIDIAPGFYQFTRVDVGFTTDYSRKVAGQGRFETGGYYDGRLNRWYGDIRISPIPHLEITAIYRYNQFRDVGDAQRNLNTHLLSTRVRLALSPRVQLIGSYQWNSANQTGIWNVRFAWEYRPLSFIFLVFNSNQTDDVLPDNRFAAQELIGKMTFLRQF
ncbi:MAG: DUF5916 domain-containing protein [Bacteroidota bacterium]